jgi:nucleolin
MATEDARKLFVAGLPESITEDVLRQLFEATGGKVVDVSLPRDRNTGRPRGFGFVTFASAEEANGARSSLDGSLQAGRAISVRPFSSEPPRRGEGVGGRPEPGGGGGGGVGGGASGSPSEDRTLYVGNLPYDVTQQEVMQLFDDNAAGPVVRVHLPAGPDGRLRGFGFVTLASAEAANSAIIALRQADVRGRRLMVNIAHPKGAPGSGGPGGPRGMAPQGGWGGGGGGGFGGDAPPEGEFGARPAYPPRAKPEEESDEGAKKKKKKGGGGGGGATGPASNKKAARPKQSWRDWDDDKD